MKYKFIFERYMTFGKMTYEYEMESYARSAEEMFQDACSLLNFEIFHKVRMFDETGRELTELY